MRRIAYVTPLYFGDDSCVGGGERYPQNLAKGVVLSSPGDFLVDLISFGKKPAYRPLAEGVRLRVIEAASAPADPLDVISWELPATLAEYDLVHVHQSATRCGEVAVLIAKQLQKPICVTDHGAYTTTLGIEYGLLELVDAVVAYSDFGGSLIQAKRPHVRVIKGGVDTSAFTPLEAPRVRDRISYVGRLLPHKGIDQLIDALPAGLPLTVCGRAYNPDYFELLRTKAQGKCVEFVTEADDAMIVDLYRRAWANVLPSVYSDCYGNTFLAPELMGFTLLEAMSCGTPAICSNVAAMPEFIRDGETGFVYDSLPQLSAILERISSEPGLADRIGQQARTTVEAEFDLKVAGRRMALLYESLIARGGAVEAA